MCGRFTLTLPTFQDVATTLGVEVRVEDALLYRPRFNIAPSDRHWIVADHGGHRGILPAIWGIPAPFAGKGLLINARLETASQKPTFRNAYRMRRCAVPADGFYEWKAEAKERTPHWFHAESRRPFLFAGLFETEPLLSFTILTRPADAIVAPIHARMPVILGLHQASAWISEAQIQTENSGIRLACHAVSSRVNSPQDDDPTLIGDARDFSMVSPE
jgi:putative SOS response-associated peptidase YedK